MTTAVPVARCPFCSPAADVRLDLAALRRVRRSGYFFPVGRLEHPILAVPTGGDVCPHLMMLGLDVRAWPPTRRARPVILFVGWRAAGLAAADPDLRANAAVRAASGAVRRPGTPHRLVAAVREGVEAGPDGRAAWRYRAEADALFALDAERFTDECAALAVRRP